MKTRTGTVAVVVELGSADRGNLARGHEPVIRNKQNETKYANANEQKAKCECSEAVKAALRLRLWFLEATSIKRYFSTPLGTTRQRTLWQADSRAHDPDYEAISQDLSKT